MDYWGGVSCCSCLASGERPHQVTEIVIFDEMLTAGIEALAEAEENGLTQRSTAINVYMAMESVRELALARGDEGAVH